MIRRMCVGALAAGALALVGAPVAGASSQTVYQAIEAQNKIVLKSQGYKLLLHPDSFKTKANLKKYLPAMEQLTKLLNTEATVVSKASTSSSAQKSGQADFVTGTRKMATGIGALVAELKDVLAGNQSAAQTQLTKEKKLETTGSALREKGDKLLGLPASE